MADNFTTMSLALYRKYRPKKLEDVVGHETTVQIIKNAAAAGRLGHAYLLFGSRGTGKTTTARLLAKLFNCQKRAQDEKFRKKGEACNACDTCQSIDANNSFDVIELDAASHRGIDEIRSITDTIHTAPSQSARRVYIIDEAHMLTPAAFNALLKTLEEPPAHAVIILATTEYEKIPATISSRTQRFLFRKIPKIHIVQKLKTIASQEGITAPEEAFEIIAAAADGSLRDAESLLDQLASLSKTIETATAQQVTGRVGTAAVHQLAEHIVSNAIPQSITLAAQLHEDGHNIQNVTRDLIHYLRRALALKVDASLAELLRSDMTGEEFLKLQSISTHIDPPRHIALMKNLIRAYSEMRYSPFATVPLELALIEYSQKTS